MSNLKKKSKTIKKPTIEQKELLFMKTTGRKYVSFIDAEEMIKHACQNIYNEDDLRLLEWSEAVLLCLVNTDYVYNLYDLQWPDVLKTIVSAAAWTPQIAVPLSRYLSPSETLYHIFYKNRMLKIKNFKVYNSLPQHPAYKRISRLQCLPKNANSMFLTNPTVCLRYLKSYITGFHKNLRIVQQLTDLSKNNSDDEDINTNVELNRGILYKKNSYKPSTSSISTSNSFINVRGFDNYVHQLKLTDNNSATNTTFNKSFDAVQMDYLKKIAEYGKNIKETLVPTTLSRKYKKL